MRDHFNAATWLVDRHLDEGSGARTAVICQRRSTTYAGLFDAVNAAASGLLALGVRPEERVMLLLDDRLEFVAAFLGALRIGAVPVPVSTMLTPSDLANLFVDARARVAVIDAAYASVASVLAVDAPELRCVVLVGDGDIDAPRLAVHRWAELQQHGGQRGEVPPYATWADSPAFWLYTSGTTGVPKAAMHRHADLRATADTYARTVLRTTSHDSFFSVSKLFFAYGLGNSLTFPLATGATTVLEPDRPTPAGVADVVRTHRPSLFFAVPSFYAALLDSELPSDTFESVRLAASAGEAMPAQVQRRFVERFETPLLDGLGSTEALHIFISNHLGRERPGTSGTVVAGYDARLLDEHLHEVVEPDQPGDLYVRGESLAMGYWCRTDASRATFQGEWARTGDVYARSADGYYTFCGRSNEMIKSGGIWVSPAELEAVLIEHPDVLEVALVGVRDEQGLERSTAFVVPRKGHIVEPDDVRAFCTQRLAGFKRPRQVVVVNELPKTPTGKVRRFQLREQLGGCHAPAADVAPSGVPTGAADPVAASAGGVAGREGT